MARLRRVAAPGEAEHGQADEARPRGLPPIAQGAAEAAAKATPERRAAWDAAACRSAEAACRVMVDLPLEVIDADAMVRAKVVLDQSELDELRWSILDRGLRLPIKTYAREEGSYRPISGYRRLRAVRSIYDELGLPGHDTIRAVVRDPDELGGAVVAIIEENKIRARVSHCERRCIAVIAAPDGGFVDVEAADSALFAGASQGKLVAGKVT